MKNNAWWVSWNRAAQIVDLKEAIRSYNARIKAMIWFRAGCFILASCLLIAIDGIRHEYSPAWLPPLCAIISMGGIIGIFFTQRAILRLTSELNRTRQKLEQLKR